MVSKALAERLQIASPEQYLQEVSSSALSKGLFSREMAVESSQVAYLAHCFTRASKEKVDEVRWQGWEDEGLYDFALIHRPLRGRLSFCCLVNARLLNLLGMVIILLFEWVLAAAVPCDCCFLIG